MNNSIKIFDDLYWVGADDRRIELFENLYPVPDGMSYNSYLILDEKNTVVDGVDSSVIYQYIDNIQSVLGDKTLDYAIINHMEPDHCAALLQLYLIYPNIKFIGNTKTHRLLKQFYPQISDSSLITVNEKDTFSTGKHKFTFYFAPMVHWPEVMNTYCDSLKVLFSADAFGSFGAISGNLYQDQVYNNENLISESRRYYSSIVGKYGLQTNSILKKLSGLDIKVICSLHGPLWRKNIDQIISLYQKWASYEAEDKTICIAYASVYGNTQICAEYLGQCLSELGLNKISIFDVSKTDVSYILSEMFRCSHIALLSCTYSNSIFPKMEFLLQDMKNHSLCNRYISVVENGSWAPQSGKLIKEYISSMKNMNIIDPMVTIKSSPTNEDYQNIKLLANNIFKSICD